MEEKTFEEKIKEASYEELLSDELLALVTDIAQTAAEQARREALYLERARRLKRYRECKKLLNGFKSSPCLPTTTDYQEYTNGFPEHDPPFFLNCGGWMCGEDGVYRLCDGRAVYAGVIPIMPTAIIQNAETGEEKIRIEFYKNGKWNALICDRLTVASPNKILELSNRGLEVNSLTAAELVRYIGDMVVLNREKLLRTVRSAGRLGWLKGDFIPYADGVIFDGEEQNKALFEAVSQQGELKEWAEFIRPLRENIYFRMQMAASFASPLIEPLGALPFVLHLWGGTGTGKTVGLMAAMSVWGNPDFGKLVRTMNMTNNAMMNTAALLNSLPFAGDELQTVKRNNQSYDSLIMQITEGINRGRMKYDRAEPLKTWHNAFLFTGEEPCTGDRSGGGAKNRVLEIEVTDKVVENGNAAANFVRTHYGTAGPRFIKELLTADIKTLYSQKFQELLSTGATEKQAMAMALCLAADSLASGLFWQGESPLSISDVQGFMQTGESVNVSQRAREFALDLIAQNENRFNNGQNGEIWGKISDGEVYINKTVLTRELAAAGFSFEAVKREWADSGFLRRNSQGKYCRQTQCFNVKANYVVLFVGNEVVNSNENVLPF